MQKVQEQCTILVLYKNIFGWLGGWAGKLAMVDTTKMTAHPVDHMTYTQAPAVCEKKINFIEFVSLSLWKITLKLIKLWQQLMEDKSVFIYL